MPSNPVKAAKNPRQGSTRRLNAQKRKEKVAKGEIA